MQFERLKILMLEQNDADAELIQHLLIKNECSYIFKIVKTKDAYKQALKEFKPDVILSDNSLPEFTAKEALEILKEKQSYTPFILVTNTVAEVFAVEIIKAGADDYILKDQLTSLKLAIETALIKKYNEKEKQQAVENLKQSVERYRNSLERVSDALVALDNNWCYTYMNKKAADLLNVDAEQMIGKHIWTEFPEGIGQPFYKAYYKAMEEQQYIYLEEYYPPYNTWFENHIYPSPNGLTIYFKDISKKKSSEEALKQSEEKYRDIVENITDIICTHDLKGKVLSVNVAAKNLLGYQMEEMLQMNIQDILQPRSKEKFGNYITKIQEEGFFKGKMYVQTKTGESRIWEVSNSLKIIDGETQIVRGFAQDVTERIGTEKELQKEKELSDKIINSLPGLFYLANPSPKMLRWNKAFEKVSGYTKEELAGMIPINLFDKEDQPSVKQSLEKTYKEGLANVEAKLLTKEGKKIPFYFTGVGIEYEGSPAILGTGIDLSEKKKAEEKLASSEKRFRALVEKNKDVIMLLDESFKVIYRSPSATEINGWTDDDVEIINSMENIHPDDLPRIKEVMEKVLANPGKTFEGIYRNRHKNGQYKWLEGVLTNMLHDKNVCAIVLNFSDVTERVKAAAIITEERDKFTKIAATSPGLIYSMRLSKDGVLSYPYASEAIKEIYGVTFEEIENAADKIFASIHKDDVDFVMQSITTTKTKLVPLKGEYRYHHPTKGLVWHEVNSLPIVESDAAVVCHGIVLDITQRKIAEQKLIKANRLYSFISQINQMIVRTTDEQMLFEEACKIAIEFGKFKMAWIGMIDKQTQTVFPVMHAGDEQGYLSAISIIASKNRYEGIGLMGTAIREGKYIVCNDIETDPLMAPWKEAALARGFNSIISLPINKNGKVIGGFAFLSAEKNFFDDAEIELLVEATGDVAFALEIIEKERLRKNAEKAVLEREKRYHTLTEVAPVGIFHADTEGNTTYVNANWSLISGLSGKKALGNGWLNAVHPKDKEVLIKKWQNATTLKDESSSEYRFLRPDGTIAWVVGHAIPERNADKKIIGYIGTITDISHQKLAAAEILKEKQLSDSVINNLPGIFYLYDEEGKFIRWNKNFEKVTGYTSEEISSMHPLDFYGKEDEAKIKARIKSVFENKMPGIEVELYTKSRNKIPYYINSHSLDYEGKKCLLGMGLDLTEIKKAEKEILKANERYEHIGNATNDALWDWNLENQSLWGNKTHQQLYGLTMQDAVPNFEQWKERIHPEDRESAVKGLELAIASNNNNFIEEYRFNTKNKGWVHVLGRTFIERNNQGKAIRLVGTMMDITERKKAAKELEESEKYLKETQAIANLGTYNLDIATGNWTGTAILDQILGVEKNFEKNFEGGQKIIHPDWRKIMADYFTELIAGKNSRFDIEYKIIRPNDNKERWIHGIGDLKFDEHSQPVTLVATIQDITDKKQAENLLIQKNEELQIAKTIAEENEEKFRTLVEQAGDGIFEVDQDGNYLQANMSASTLTGYSIEELVKMNAKDIVPIEELKANPIKIEEIKKGKPVYAERIIRKKDGTLVNVEISAKLMDTGKVISILRDITQRKKAEEAINESEEKYRTLVEQASDAIFIADENGKFITVNSSACTMSGFTEKELLKKTIYDFAIIEDLKKKPFHFKELKEGKTMLIERVMKVKGSVVMHIEVTAKLLSDGKLLAFVRDISGRKKSQQALAESENRLRTIYNTEPECIKILGPKGELIEMNPAGLAMIEADDLEQIKGHSVIEIINKPYRKAFLALIKNVFKEKPGLLEFEIKGLKGTGRWLETHAVPLKNSEGKIISLLGVTRDITERKKAEQEIILTTEKLRQLTAHLQRVREDERKRIGREIHDELGQQLTAIKMDVSWIDKKSPDASPLVKDKLKNVIKLLDGSNLSIRRILNELRPGILDDNGLLEALEWLISQFTSQTGIPVRFKTSEKELKLPEQLATTIYRIYQEAFTNITRYARASKVVTSLNIVKDKIIITIEDNGIGFDTATIQSKKSFGILGMRERVFSLNGHFALISAPGKGTEITIVLPLIA